MPCSMAFGSMCNRSMSQSMFNIDSEVSSLQDRLVFPRNVGPFQILGPNRHIIFSGDLYMVDGWKWVKVHLMLLSDMILLTQMEGNKQVIALREPIHLRDVSELYFTGFHPSEFTIAVESPSPSSFVFRTLHAEERCTWQHLLEQRINTCRTQREYAL